MELDLSVQVRLDVVTEVGDTVLVEMLGLGHQAERYNVRATFRFLQLLITEFAHVLLVLQLCHNTLTTNHTTPLHIRDNQKTPGGEVKNQRGHGKTR